MFTSSFGSMTVHDLGRLGVVFFFVHTALVLMSSLERQGQEGHWVRAFYVRRAYRIYPLAIVTTLAWLTFRIPPAVGSLTHRVTFVPFSTREILANIALVQNLTGAHDVNGVLWSLPLEVQMYVALPFCYLVARKRPVGILAMLATGVMAWTVGTALDVPGFWRLSLLTFTPCFLAGVLAYAILYRTRSAPRVLPAKAWPLLLLAVFVLAAPLHVWEHVVVQWYICIAIGCAIPLCRDLGSSIVTRAAHVVCEYSYGIYLTHFAALWLGFVVCRGLPFLERIGVFVAASAGLAYVCYHAIERPYIAVGRQAGARLLVSALKQTRDELSELAA